MNHPNTPPLLSIVVPAYRSAQTLPELVDRLLKVMRGISPNFEIIFVEDGGNDETWSTIKRLQVANPEIVVGIQLMRNFGQHNALMCGFRHARGKWVVTLDDDLQNPPEEIPKLIAAAEQQGADVVYGVPDAKEHEQWRNAGSRLVNMFFRLVFRSRVTVTSFRIVRRELIDCILSYSLNYTYIDGLLAWNSQRLAQTTVEHHPRREGRSGYSFGKLATLALNLFTNFSLLPLQVVSGIGLFAAIGGVALGFVYLLLSLFSRITVPGYASTIVAVLVLGGLQLLSLGLMGEYLGRIHLNINRKPQYAIRQVLEEAPDRAEPTDFEAAKTAQQANAEGKRTPESAECG